MSVTVHFRCCGCTATAEGTEPLRREFRSFSGRSYGFGTPVAANDVESVTPDGWIAFDPYTYACYCPECWESILAPNPATPEPTP